MYNNWSCLIGRQKIIIKSVYFHGGQKVCSHNSVNTQLSAACLAFVSHCSSQLWNYEELSDAELGLCFWYSRATSVDKTSTIIHFWQIVFIHPLIKSSSPKRIILELYRMIILISVFFFIEMACSFKHWTSFSHYLWCW